MEKGCERCGAPVRRSDRRFCSRSCAAYVRHQGIDIRGAASPNWQGGKTQHPSYARWNNMLQRCYSPTSSRYYCYGARGIVVCDRWRQDFWAYVADIGDPPSGPGRWTIDRIDNDGPYELGNVRWASDATQARGQRKLDRREAWQAVTAVAYGRTAKEVAEHFGVSSLTIRRLVDGTRPILMAD